MNKKLLLLDLDGTVIYSKRHLPQTAVRCVEWLSEEPQGYMTQTAYEYFRTQTAYDVVPLTARTPLQVQRLLPLFSALGWGRLLLCNGALLLEGGAEATDWTAQTAALAQPHRGAFEAAAELAQGIPGTRFIYRNDFMFYLRAEAPVQVTAWLTAQTDPVHLYCYHDSRKVYGFIRAVTKGAGAQRLCQRLGAADYRAAGDGIADLSMLRRAEIGYCPPALADDQHWQGRRVDCGGIFSDTLCAALQQGRGSDLPAEDCHERRNRFDTAN